MPNLIADTPKPPYYAVVFTSRRTDVDGVGYAAAAERMIELAREQAGFLGVESVRDANGVGITVSYWQDAESIQRWRDLEAHRAAQEQGRSAWYDAFRVRVCLVEREYEFENE